MSRALGNEAFLPWTPGGGS